VEPVLAVLLRLARGGLGLQLRRAAGGLGTKRGDLRGGQETCRCLAVALLPGGDGVARPGTEKAVDSLRVDVEDREVPLNLTPLLAGQRQRLLGRPRL